MRFDRPAALEDIMKEHGETKAQLAAFLGISKQRIYQVFCGDGSWTLEQAQKISAHYDLDPFTVCQIFLPEVYAMYSLEYIE